MGSLIEELQRREAAARQEVDELRGEIARLNERLVRAEERLSRLQVTRETVAEILGGVGTDQSAAGQEVEPAAAAEAASAGSLVTGGPPIGMVTVPPWRPGLAQSVLPPSYRDLLEVRADAGRPLRAGSIAAAAGLSTGKSKIEGLRSKLKRLVERGWLAEDGPGLFMLPRRDAQGASSPAHLGGAGGRRPPPDRADRSGGRPPGSAVRLVIDLVRVLEYLWAAAWCFHARGDPAAEDWVAVQALAVLAGRARQVAESLSAQASQRGLAESQRAGVEACVRYLTNNKEYLLYDEALASGWPIATGVVEGACRHLIGDRLDITGSRWGVEGAEAVLRLRAVIDSGDFEPYWAFHIRPEHNRVHPGPRPG